MKIIAVDDKPMPRRALVRAITQAAPQATVSECANAEEVLALPDLASYEVAFVDIDMPGMSGLQLARELKRINPQLNIIFATGYGEYSLDAFEMHSSGYLMKPITAEKVRRELDDLRHPSAPQHATGLVVRCFGDFEVFCDGHPVNFERAKTKELLAYLIDRNGAVVSLGKVEAAIWGDERNQRVSSSYLRTLVADLRHTLKACGHEDVIVRRYGEIGIDISHLSCDYYDLLTGDPQAVAAWRGEYMSQYSWAEPTKAALLANLQGPYASGKKGAVRG